MNNNRKQKVIELLIIVIIFICLMFFLVIVPLGVSYGIINGELDIETLEPISVQEQIMIQGGSGKY